MTGPLVLALSMAGCLPVDSDRILAKDLAPAAAVFAALPPETPFGHAPAPGSRRILGAGELKRLAAPHDLPLAPGAEFCVVRSLEPLTKERLIASMRASLPEADARFEVTDFSSFPVPRGELRFPLSGLRRPPLRTPGGPVLWKGYVEYAARRRYPVWARVRIAVETARVLARVDLAAGSVVEAGQLKLESSEGFPPGDRSARSIEQVAGRVLRRPVRAGAEVPLGSLAEPREVERGDPVRVEAASGLATVEITGRAESSGSRGDTVVVRNLASGRSFRARVKGKGSVVVSAEQGRQR
ncbi:MAG TPA: flagellar basal body P-ring formation chaperone FlgA [Bryobacteraceae bacterium]|nr:flagellar basal body P-ring formation chaperone FlgA [Bryobacteraceae bacterium]